MDISPHAASTPLVRGLSSRDMKRSPSSKTMQRLPSVPYGLLAGHSAAAGSAAAPPDDGSSLSSSQAAIDPSVPIPTATVEWQVMHQAPSGRWNRSTTPVNRPQPVSISTLERSLRVTEVEATHGPEIRPRTTATAGSPPRTASSKHMLRTSPSWTAGGRHSPTFGGDDVQILDLDNWRPDEGDSHPSHPSSSSHGHTTAFPGFQSAGAPVIMGTGMHRTHSSGTLTKAQRQAYLARMLESARAVQRHVPVRQQAPPKIAAPTEAVPWSPIKRPPSGQWNAYGAPSPRAVPLSNEAYIRNLGIAARSTQVDPGHGSLWAPSH